MKKQFDTKVAPEVEQAFSEMCLHLQFCILLHDLEGWIVDCNSVVCQELGYSQDALLKMNIKDIQPSQCRESDESGMALSVIGDMHLDFSSAVFVRQSGTRFKTLVKTSCFRFDEQESGQRTLVQRLFKPTQTAEIGSPPARLRTPEPLKMGAHYNELQCDWVHIVAKELKSPVDALLMSVSQLNESDGAQDEDQVMAGIQQYSMDLMHRIHDFIDYLKLSRGEMAQTQESTHLLNTIEDTLAYFQEMSPEYLSRIHCFVDPDIPEYLDLDAIKLQKILARLILNSLRRADKGLIKLYVQLEDHQQIKFVIIDNGSLISEKDQRILFGVEKYQAVSVSEPMANSAFGYMMASQLLLSMNSELTYHQLGPEMSLFAFKIHVADMTTALPSVKGFLNETRIVLIDDYLDSNQSMEKQLDSWGADVKSFVSETDMVRFFSDFNPELPVDLIVLHFHNGSKNHASLLRSIGQWLQVQREDAPEWATSVLVIAPDDIPTGLARLLSRLPHTFLTFPYSVSGLANKVARLLRRPDPYEFVTDYQPIKINTEKASHYAGAKVLLVDDSPITQRALAAFMKQQGFLVSFANSGAEAIDRLQQEAFDLIMMDVEMPEMSGVQCTDILRSQMNITIPIIGVTGVMTDDVWHRCLTQGMNDYMTKPIDRTILVATLGYWLEQHGFTKNTGSEPVGEHSGGLDIQKLSATLFGQATLEKLIGDTDVNAVEDMLRLFFEETQIRMEKINHSSDISNSVLSAHQLQQVANEIRAIKSACDTFGLVGIDSAAALCLEFLDKQKIFPPDSFIDQLSQQLADTEAVFEQHWASQSRRGNHG